MIICLEFLATGYHLNGLDNCYQCKNQKKINVNSTEFEIKKTKVKKPLKLNNQPIQVHSDQIIQVEQPIPQQFDQIPQQFDQIPQQFQQFPQEFLQTMKQHHGIDEKQIHQKFYQQLNSGSFNIEGLNLEQQPVLNPGNQLPGQTDYPQNQSNNCYENQPNDQQQNGPFYDEDYFESQSDDSVNREYQYHIEMEEKFKDCQCCHGNVFDCQAPTCIDLGGCYCYIQWQIEQDEIDESNENIESDEINEEYKIFLSETEKITSE